jgi:hypothetical protein
MPDLRDLDLPSGESNPATSLPGVSVKLLIKPSVFFFPVTVPYINGIA